MTPSQEQKFRIVKTVGFVTDYMDGMTSQEIYALVRTRLGAGRASTILIELEQRGCASVLYAKSFGNKARLDIQKVA